MGVVTFTDSITSPVPASKLFKVLFADPASHVPKIAPQFVKSIETIHGTGGPGSILQFNFAEGAPVKYVKHKVDVLDNDNLSYADTVIEGGELSDKIESVTHEIKLESSPEGGAISKTVVKYHLKAGAELTGEEVKPAKEGAHAIFKVVEAYLLANSGI